MRRIEIEFSSQSKSVVSKVNISEEGGDPNDLITTAKNLFDAAEKYALNKTFERNK